MAIVKTDVTENVKDNFDKALFKSGETAASVIRRAVLEYCEKWGYTNYNSTL